MGGKRASSFVPSNFFTHIKTFRIMEHPINRVLLTGHIGREIELKTVTGGGKLVSFSIATNESYTSRTGERVTDTNWHNVVAWGGLAERIAATMNKGMEVTVEGSLRSRSYEDKEGKRRYVTDVLLVDCQRVLREQPARAEEPAC